MPLARDGCLALLLALGGTQPAPAAAAQAHAPVATQRTPAPPDLPATVRTALAQVRDESFTYGQPGFYALLDFVQSSGADAPPPDPVALDDWRTLLDRPADFRGLPIALEGVVGRNSAFRHQQPPHDALGTLWELQLRRDDQPIIVKVVLTQDAGDVPIGAQVRITARFALIQQFYSETHRVRQAAVFVGRGPSAVILPPPPAAGPAPADALVALVLGIAALVVVWLYLRRRTSAAARAARLASQEARATEAPSRNLSAELEEWARRRDP